MAASRLLLCARGFGCGTCSPHMNIRGWRLPNARRVGIPLSLFDPGLDFGKVPDDTAGRQAEAAREFAALFHLINGAVRKRDQQSERHCQTNLSWPAKGAGLRRSGCELTPLGQGGRTVLFEDITAVEVAVVVEVVVD